MSAPEQIPNIRGGTVCQSRANVRPDSSSYTEILKFHKASLSRDAGKARPHSMARDGSNRITQNLMDPVIHRMLGSYNIVHLCHLVCTQQVRLS